MLPSGSVDAPPLNATSSGGEPVDGVAVNEAVGNWFELPPSLPPPPPQATSSEARRINAAARQALPGWIAASAAGAKPSARGVTEHQVDRIIGIGRRIS